MTALHGAADLGVTENSSCRQLIGTPRERARTSGPSLRLLATYTAVIAHPWKRKSPAGRWNGPKPTTPTGGNTI